MNKLCKKVITAVLTAVMIAGAVFALTACGGYKVTYLLPEGATGTLPKAATYAQYDEFTLPAVADAAMPHAEQIGWRDTEGNYYANGEKFTMGGFDITLTAVFQGKSLGISYCENAGNFFMPGKGDLGPTPAFTHIYADKTWTAEATGKAMFSSFAGTWDLSSDGKLTMKLVTQDGIDINEDVEVDMSDERCFSWTLSHPSDRSGTSLKYHKNHISRYDFIKAYNAEFAASIALPAEPSFTLTFGGNGNEAAPVTGEQAEITAKVGETVILPACAFVREGYTFGGWQIAASENVAKNAGETFEMVSWDLVVKAQWTADA